MTNNINNTKSVTEKWSGSIPRGANGLSPILETVFPFTDYSRATQIDYIYHEIETFRYREDVLNCYSALYGDFW